jgi:hypothetical protein
MVPEEPAADVLMESSGLEYSSVEIPAKNKEARFVPRACAYFHTFCR